MTQDRYEFIASWTFTIILYWVAVTSVWKNIELIIQLYHWIIK